ncbi:hypothetical protein Ais01nite_47610 [Asanoa ishikariensis]|uniref:Serine/threonine protein kinase n=1 Tax=Asanoa ishikariensis TaxID=137265 RepID=A0A1H3RX17_9ACTN|nr:NACHT domain-containing protein [Asanoa ishikariensis]GIF66726.1 hypothetical protein Ais01nite_47610 [Asanoa ishikariensis]SDZ30256.1 serine/threonine protein kinase [Asanoa ishikariensis]
MDVRLRDARGMVIGEHNTVYQNFFDARHAPLAAKLISFADLIAEKTQHFVGRRFAVDAVDQFIARNSAGYLVIEGMPGIGKTSLLAHLAATRGWAHHFVVGALGISRAEQFLENVSAQLIAKYDLDRAAALPPEASRDGSFLAGVLSEVSAGLPDGATAVVLVDALDEVFTLHDVHANVLYLPPTLPRGVFFVVTTRPRERDELALRTETREFFYLDPRSSANQADVLAYIDGALDRDQLRTRLSAWGATPADFAETLLAKAEGNFMYLHHVLPAIEQGRFADFALDDLPQGLEAYYDAHWRQMRAAGGGDWAALWQPAIVFLAAAREPVTVSQIAAWTGLPPPQIQVAVRRWREFLDVERVDGQRRYRIYHSSFHDFLGAKDDVDLRAVNSTIADRLLDRYRELKDRG